MSENDSQPKHQAVSHSGLQEELQDELPTESPIESKKTPGAELRGATRYPAQGEFTLSLDGGELIHKGQLKDVSDSGVFVKMGTPPSESCVNKNGKMTLVSDVDGKVMEITGDVRVIRVTARGAGLYINAIDQQARMDFVKLMISVRYNNS